MSINNARTATASLLKLADSLKEGLTFVDKELVDASSPAGIDEDRLFKAIRSVAVNGRLSQAEVDMFNAILRGEPAPPLPVQQIGLVDADFKWGMSRLACTYAQIRAVDEVESGGGWYQDIRADILSLDGPGGFLDGPALPKILFEAHHFSRLTGGKYDTTNPNISSAKWNQALYVGGQAEWTRLWKAMQLDKEAALKSASYGRYQIMGFNYKLAGYASVEAYVDDMKKSERLQLEAFVNFVLNSGLADELRKISNVHADCIPFAEGYNGAGQAKLDPPYNVRLARAHKKYEGVQP